MSMPARSLSRTSTHGGSLVLTVLLMAPGCRIGANRVEFQTVREDWSFQGAPGLRLVTDHFDLFTTITDAQLLLRRKILFVFDILFLKFIF
ncbi:MAG: hypothetical protein ACE5GE_10665, partial [Phycisphaerae bacterium]